MWGNAWERKIIARTPSKSPGLSCEDQVVVHDLPSLEEAELRFTVRSSFAQCFTIQG
jgi:hypothetical protein